MNRPFFSFALFFFLFVLLLIVKSNILRAPYYWDVLGYVNRAASSFYKTGQIASLTGMTGHPPLFFIALASLWKLFGNSLLVSHVFILFLGASSLFFLFKLANKLYGPREAVAATLLLLSNQLFFAQVGTIYLSTPVTCLAILTVYLYLDQKYLLYGISAAAMLLVKETAIVVLLAIILCDFFRTVLNKEKFLVGIRRMLFLSLPVVPLGFWYLYHWHMTGWLVNTKLIVNRSRFFGLFLDNAFRYLIFDNSAENVTKVNWVVFLGLSVFIVFHIAKRKSLKLEMVFLMIIIMNILFFSYSDDLPRYFLVIYPFYFVLGSRAFVFISERVKYKDILISLFLVAMIAGSVMNYTGHRNTDGWRLESNMEYLDFIKVSRWAGQFLEDNYPDYKIITTFPLSAAYQNPRLGYIKKALSVIPFDKFNDFEEILVVRTYQANYLFFNKFLQANKHRLVKIKEFFLKGKRIIIYRKKKEVLSGDLSAYNFAYKYEPPRQSNTGDRPAFPFGLRAICRDKRISQGSKAVESHRSDRPGFDKGDRREGRIGFAETRPGTIQNECRFQDSIAATPREIGLK